LVGMKTVISSVESRTEVKFELFARDTKVV
jgi:hypothetical protein